MTGDSPDPKKGWYGTPEERARSIAAWPAEKRRLWIFQNCYFGHGRMLARDVCSMLKDGKEFVQTMYFCECGYSLVQYVPRTLMLQVVDEDCLQPPLQPQGVTNTSALDVP